MWFKYEYGWVWKLEIDEKGQRSKKSKCWILTLKNQTLTDFIFKCDLNFGEMNTDSCLGGWN